MISPVSSGSLYLTAFGNHDFDSAGLGQWGTADSGGECGVVSNVAFGLPSGHNMKNPW
jgi:hypothetical protein